MRALSEEDLIRVWEIGIDQHPLDRAITLLAAVLPETAIADLHQLTIGQRDGLLLLLYERTFGPQLSGRSVCPDCQEIVEFILRVADVRLPTASEQTTGEPTTREQTTREIVADGYTLTFRLPNSLDLAALVRQDDPASARRALAERCLLRVTQEGQAVETQHLSDQALAQLAAAMATNDPQAEIELDLACTRCTRHWSVLLDIVTFFWMDLCRHVKRLFYDVHLLAAAYGWREADILAMSAARRQIYLTMLGA